MQGFLGQCLPGSLERQEVSLKRHLQILQGTFRSCGWPTAWGRWRGNFIGEFPALTCFFLVKFHPLENYHCHPPPLTWDFQVVKPGFLLRSLCLWCDSSWQEETETRLAPGQAGCTIMAKAGGSGSPHKQPLGTRQWEIWGLNRVGKQEPLRRASG